MKKLFTLLSIAMLTTSINAQEYFLSQNTDDNVTGSNSVACEGGDNSWARQFFLTDYDITGDIKLVSGRIGVQSISANETVTVNIYEADYDFPFGDLTLIGSQDVLIPSNSGVGYVEYDFDEPVFVSSDVDVIVVEVFQDDTGIAFFIGGTAGQTMEPFLRSFSCGVEEFDNPSSIGFPNANFYITVTGEDEMGTIELGSSRAMSVYPNPATDVLNVKMADNKVATSMEVVNLAGQTVLKSEGTDALNVNFLAPGNYILRVKDANGTTHMNKFIKK